MKANPFSLERGPSWLSVEAPSVIRDRLRKAVDRNPLLSEQAPQISGNRALSAVTAFFSEVTSPLAEMIETLYTSPLLREASTVAEIIRRMAEAVRRPPLPPEVVVCVCATFIRLSIWSTMAVTRSPLTEAVIWVYWNDAILCCALADELCYEDGTYRPYWFPYPRLGE